MRATLLIVVLLQITKLSAQQTCTNGILCKTATDYVLCTVSNGQITELSSAMSCPSGQICDSQNEFVCVASTTTISTTTPLITTTTTTQSPGSCENNIICKSSNSYALCTIQGGRVVDLSRPQPCPNGLICDASSQFGCVGSSLPTTESTVSPNDPTTASSTSATGTTSSSTTETTTNPTTSTQAPTTPMQCTANGNFSAPQCNQYYRCLYVMWWWDLQLLTCPNGQAFNSETQECVEASQVNCTSLTTTQNTVTSNSPTEASSTSDAPKPSSSTSETTPSSATETITNPTTLTPAPTTPMQCTANGNFAASQCNQYYRCVYVMWWWDLQLLTCPNGEAFNTETQQCVEASQVNCTVT